MMLSLTATVVARCRQLPLVCACRLEPDRDSL